MTHAREPNTTHDKSDFVVADIRTVLRLAHICTDRDTCSLQRAPYTQCFCFELFRHAIVRRDDLAWEALYTRYAPLVRHWLGACTGADESDEEVAVVFGRFWQAVDAAKFARFDSLAAVLRYLKLTARAVRLDRIRTTGAHGNWLLPGAALAEASAHEDMAEAVARRVDSPGFWRTVRHSLTGEREELVFHLSYIMDLSPREIRARHGAQFPDVDEVYRLKRNALDRLRRAPEMRALLHTS